MGGPKPVDPSLCKLCLGFLHMDSRRGFIKEIGPDEFGYIYGRYVYTYLHHANIAALVQSAEAGCAICESFCKALKRSAPSKSKPFNTSFEAEKNKGSVQPNSEALDKDILAGATQLAGPGNRDLYRQVDLSQQRAGQITIASQSNDRSGPWWNGATTTLTATAIGTGLSSGLSFFHSPCMHDSHQHIVGL